MASIALGGPDTARAPAGVTDHESGPSIERLSGPELDDIVRLAAQICGAPVALVTVIRDGTLTLEAHTGFEDCDWPVDAGFCPEVVRSGAALTVTDSLADPGHAANGAAQGGIRFYAGVPLVLGDGQAFGTLCVMDWEPRTLAPSQSAALTALARQVIAQLDLRASLRREREMTARFDLIVNGAIEHAIVGTDPAGRVTAWNPAAERTLGWRADEMLGRSLDRVFTPQDQAAGRWQTEMRRALANGFAGNERWHQRRDGSLFWASGEVTPLRDAAGAPAGFLQVLRDRTEQHLAGQRLAASEEQYRTLFEAIDAGFCVIEMRFEGDVAVDYRFIEVNPAFARHTGLADAAGRWMRDMAPDHEQHWFDTYGRVARTGIPVRFDDAADSLGRFYEVQAFRVGDPGAGRVAVLFNDVSDRKRAELALSASEAYWHGLFEQLQEGFFIGELVRDAGGAARDWRFLDMNAAWERMSGLDRAQATGRTAREVLADFSEDWVTDYIQVAETGEPAAFTRSVGAAGRFYQVSAFQIRPDRFAVLFLEVTEREKANARRSALLTLSDGLRTHCSASDLAFAAVELLGRFLDANRAGYGTIGHVPGLIRVERDWTEAESAGLTRDHRYEDYGSFYEALLRGETVAIADVEADDRTAAKAGAWRSIGSRSMVHVPVLEQNGLVAVIYVNDSRPRTWTADEIDFIRDVGQRTRTAIERRRAEQELAALTASLEAQVKARTVDLVAAEESLRQSQKMEAVGQLTGGLAHDFNNLLTGIVGSLELLGTRIGQGRMQGLERYINAAQGACARAAALTHRLLAFSRRQTLDPKPTDGNALVAGMEDMIRRTVGPAIDIRVSADPGLWVTRCDPNQLENALLNLCINARDAMPDGGTLSITTANADIHEGFAVARDMLGGQYVCMSVTDTGSGMPPEVVARAFDPFFTTKPLGQGTGLGLSMIYGFVKQSGGQVRIHSTEGMGTTVSLYLPRFAGALPAEKDIAGLVEAPRADAGQTVVVVDDEPAIRMLLTDVLEELGYAVVEAADGPSGLKILQSDIRIDLLVTDVGLPGGMNGRQMADAARADRPDLKVLFITGYAEGATLGDVSLGHRMEVMTKPFAMEALATRIRSMILA